MPPPPLSLLVCAKFGAVPLGYGGERFGGPARGILAEGAGAKVVESQDHEPVDAEVLPVP